MEELVAVRRQEPPESSAYRWATNELIGLHYTNKHAGGLIEGLDEYCGETVLVTIARRAPLG